MTVVRGASISATPSQTRSPAESSIAGVENRERLVALLRQVTVTRSLSPI